MTEGVWFISWPTASPPPGGFAAKPSKGDLSVELGPQHGRRGVFVPSPALGVDLRIELNLALARSPKSRIGQERTGRDNLKAA